MLEYKRVSFFRCHNKNKNCISCLLDICHMFKGIGNNATSKVAIFSNFYKKKSTKTTQLACNMLCVADALISIR